MNFAPIINSLPPEVWFAILGGVVTVVTQATKKWLSLQSPKVIMALTAALSALATIIPALLTAVNHNPAVLGQHAVTVIGVATLLYRYIVQPADTFLENYKSYKATALAATAPAAPVATITPVATAPTTDEFIG